MPQDKFTEDYLEQKCHFWLKDILILTSLETSEYWGYIWLVLIFLGICCGPQEKAEYWARWIILVGFFLHASSQAKKKKKIDCSQNMKSWSSWQQDHQGWCFPNSLPCNASKTQSPSNTVWRIAGCLLLITNGKESQYRTPPWIRITIAIQLHWLFMTSVCRELCFTFLWCSAFQIVLNVPRALQKQPQSSMPALPKYFHVFSSSWQQQHCQNKPSLVHLP